MENWRTGLWVSGLELRHHLKSVRTPQDARVAEVEAESDVGKNFLPLHDGAGVAPQA
jgi:hypothetical protein